MSEVANAFTTPSQLIPGVKGATKNLFRTPSPTEAPATPNAETKAVQTATAEAAQRRSRARGFQSTILSQPGELKATFGS
jgi:hypothetical protein